MKSAPLLPKSEAMLSIRKNYVANQMPSDPDLEEALKEYDLARAKKIEKAEESLMKSHKEQEEGSKLPALIEGLSEEILRDTTDKQEEPTSELQSEEVTEELEKETSRAVLKPTDNEKRMTQNFISEEARENNGNEINTNEQFEEAQIIETAEFDELTEKEFTEDGEQVLELAEGMEQTGIEPFATTAIKEEHPVKYHPNSILFYFGNIERPDWDTELENNVFSAEMSKEFIIKSMEGIIEEYGSKIYVYERKSDTREEFHELIQLQFCLQRDMARGTRTKSALIPISSLTTFANKLTPREPTVSDGERNDGERNDVVLERSDKEIPPDEQSELPVETSTQTEQPRKSVQVQISEGNAYDKVVEAYRNSVFDRYGKPIFNTAVTDMTKRKEGVFSGPGNVQDPAGLFKPAFVIRSGRSG
jgi:hypothetical protein